ncbi:hypothetical protein N8Z40_03495 [Pseudomonadales bacterium]|nr:hypothetical protein [Pseudomonadales bacterium]
MTHQRSQKLGRVAALFALTGALLLLTLTWLPTIDAAANQYLNDALNSHLLVYASARTINAIISVIASIEVSLNFGAGVALQPGEALDPLNDLIERFSGFVLYGLAALGLQQVVLVAAGSAAAKVLTSCAVIGALTVYLWRIKIPAWLMRLLLLLMFVRFVLVLQVGLSWGLDKLYFDIEQQQALASLNLVKDHLHDLRASYMQSINASGFFSGTWQAAQALIGTDEQQSITDIAATAIIRLLVILLLQSLLLPLVFIWLIWLILKSIITRPTN